MSLLIISQRLSRLAPFPFKRKKLGNETLRHFVPSIPFPTQLQFQSSTKLIAQFLHSDATLVSRNLKRSLLGTNFVPRLLHVVGKVRDPIDLLKAVRVVRKFKKSQIICRFEGPEELGCSKFPHVVHKGLAKVLTAVMQREALRRVLHTSTNFLPIVLHALGEGSMEKVIPSSRGKPTWLLVLLSLLEGQLSLPQKLEHNLDLDNLVVADMMRKHGGFLIAIDVVKENSQSICH